MKGFNIRMYAFLLACTLGFSSLQAMEVSDAETEHQEAPEQGDMLDTTNERLFDEERREDAAKQEAMQQQGQTGEQTTEAKSTEPNSKSLTEGIDIAIPKPYSSPDINETLADLGGMPDADSPNLTQRLQEWFNKFTAKFKNLFDRNARAKAEIREAIEDSKNARTLSDRQKVVDRIKQRVLRTFNLDRATTMVDRMAQSDVGNVKTLASNLSAEIDHLQGTPPGFGPRAIEDLANRYLDSSGTSEYRTSTPEERQDTMDKLNDSTKLQTLKDTLQSKLPEGQYLEIHIPRNGGRPTFEVVDSNTKVNADAIQATYNELNVSSSAPDKEVQEAYEKRMAELRNEPTQQARLTKAYKELMDDRKPSLGDKMNAGKRRAGNMLRSASDDIENLSGRADRQVRRAGKAVRESARSAGRAVSKGAKSAWSSVSSEASELGTTAKNQVELARTSSNIRRTESDLVTLDRAKQRAQALGDSTAEIDSQIAEKRKSLEELRSKRSYLRSRSTAANRSASMASEGLFGFDAGDDMSPTNRPTFEPDQTAANYRSDVRMRSQGQSGPLRAAPAGY